MFSPLRSRFFVLALIRLIGCVVAIAAVLVAINLRGEEPPADLQNKRGKLPKDVVARSTDLSAPAGTVTKPPVARVDVVHDTYFGETLEDPYRWMENG